MANQNKNWINRRTKKMVREYERAQNLAAQARWLIQNADQERILSGSRPGLINRYKINENGSWVSISKDEVKV